MTFSRAVTILATLCACDPTTVETFDEPVESGPDELAGRVDPVGAAADCCEDDAAPGCSDVSVEECVCDADPYCCATAWDSICVGEVESLGCGTCTDAGCCSPTATAGCTEPSVEACVCDEDPYCCATAWDSICVGEVESLGCGTCGGIDLLVSDIGVPLAACPGENIASGTSLEVTNGGSVGVTSFFHVGWYLSADETLDAGDTLLVGGRDQVLSLAAGASTSLGIGGSNQIPPAAAPGSYFLLAAVDEFDQHAEFDESNNVVARPISISTCGGPSEWAQRVGGTGAEVLETGSSVAVDGDGNVYTLLSFWSGSVTLGGTTYTLRGTTDALLVSYDADGVLRWAKHIGGTGLDLGRGIAVDDDGNVYVVGETEGPLDLGGGPLAPVPGHVRDIWMASYDGAGAHRWSQRRGGSGLVLLTDVAVGEGSVIVTGHMTGTLNVGGGLLTSAGDADLLLFSLGSDGSHQWSRRLGGTNEDHANAVAIDASGELVVAGYFAGTANFGTGALVSAGSADALVLGLDASGVTRWARRFGSTAIDIAQDAAVDDDGNAYAVSGFAGTIDLGAGPIVSAGNQDVIVASWNHDGTLRWARRGGSTQLDYIRGLVLDSDGDPVITGSFFGPTASFGGAALPNAGNYDTFLAGFAAATGAHQWSESFGGATRDDGYDLALSPTGALLLVGTTNGTFTIAGTSVSTTGGDDVFVASLIE